MQFFQLPALHFGAGAVRELAGELSRLNVDNPLLLTDRGVVASGTFERASAVLGTSRGVVFDAIPENPTFAGVDAAFSRFCEAECDGVVAIGGGSVIDSAKIVAVLARQGGTAADYVGFSERIGPRVAPLIVIPTTAGTGSEASPDAGVHPDSTSLSSGVTSRHVVPKVAICDPMMTLTLPTRLTAATGLDALTHCIEGFLAEPASPVIDAMALDGIGRACRYLRAAVADGGDIIARQNVMMAAFEGGAAIGKGLGPGHAIAISCGDQGLHHGVLSAIGVLATVRFQTIHVPDKIGAVARAMDLPGAADVEGGLRVLMRGVGLPLTLHEAGYQIRNMKALARQCEASPFNRASRYAPSAADFEEMLASVASS
ncbi:iron-containing alcohol dehydrogenase [Bradyrhizobium sp. 14AA]